MYSCFNLMWVAHTCSVACLILRVTREKTILLWKHNIYVTSSLYTLRSFDLMSLWHLKQKLFFSRSVIKCSQQLTLPKAIPEYELFCKVKKLFSLQQNGHHCGLLISASCRMSNVCECERCHAVCAVWCAFLRRMWPSLNERNKRWNDKNIFLHLFFPLRATSPRFHPAAWRDKEGTGWRRWERARGRGRERERVREGEREL